MVFLAMFPLHISQRELFYIAKKTTATKMKRRAQQASVAPEDARPMDANGDDEILIVRMDLSIVLSNPQ